LASESVRAVPSGVVTSASFFPSRIPTVVAIGYGAAPDDGHADGADGAGGQSSAVPAAVGA
jgi:hypothetical protein